LEWGLFFLEKIQIGPKWFRQLWRAVRQLAACLLTHFPSRGDEFSARRSSVDLSTIEFKVKKKSDLIKVILPIFDKYFPPKGGKLECYSRFFPTGENVSSYGGKSLSRITSCTLCFRINSMIYVHYLNFKNNLLSGVMFFSKGEIFSPKGKKCIVKI
jgi:hypothetical protein